tara:strand:+ start:577 stop:3084 length:2508 start_codon:yes stop_codon:yes gene_type:complete
MISETLYSQSSNDNFVLFENQTYTAFNGNTYNSYRIETNYTVVYIIDSLLENYMIEDRSTLTKIFDRIDKYYKFYLDKTGYEPPGGNPQFNNKTNVFFGPTSCGSGCGLLGTKGIELSGFSNIYFTIKNDLNVQRDVIISYEFGRNWFNFSNKLIYPGPFDGDFTKNGGFAEGFADTMYLNSTRDIITDTSQIDLNETFLQMKRKFSTFIGYYSNVEANPINSLFNWEFTGTQDPNHGRDGYNFYDGSYQNTVIWGIFEVFGIDNLLPDFISNLNSLPNVSNPDQSLDNLSLSIGRSLNKNVYPFFKNILKFDISDIVRDELNTYPSLENRLITDNEVLWFISPQDTITLSMRSLNYLNDNATYRIKNGDTVLLVEDNGNFRLDFGILEGNTELDLICEMVINGYVVDSYPTKLKIRNDFNLLDFPEKLYSYYLSNKIFSNNIQNDTLVMENIVVDKLGYGNVLYDFVFSQNRIYKLSAKIKHNSFEYDSNTSTLTVGELPTSGYTHIRFQTPLRVDGTSRVGYDLGDSSSEEFYYVEKIVSSSDFIPPDRKYFTGQINIESVGYGNNVKISEIKIEDITDTDGDGILDVEDLVFNLPQNNFSISVESLSCIGENDGSISITVEDEDLNYTLRVNGDNPVDLNSSQGYQQTLSNLSPGIYQLCFTVEGESGYNQCFDINITEPAPLSASAKVNKSRKSISFSLDGSDRYTIVHNGVERVFDVSNPEIQLKKGVNFIEVKTDKLCQGTYTEEVFISEKVEFYPNPTVDLVNLYIHGKDKTVDLKIVDRDGNIIGTSCSDIQSNRKVQVNLDQYPKGIYLIQAKGETVQKTIKIIRE